MSVVKSIICCIIFVYLSKTSGKITPSQYAELRSDITSLIKEKNCAPILVRLAWHDAGTYDAASKTGGPRAAQRFTRGESTHDANAGLNVARDLLAPLVVKYCDTNIISIADLWACAGNVAVYVSSGPDIPFRFGRIDINNPSECVEDGRLPDAKQGVKHIRNVFGRMGFKSDKYIVALSGAHSLGSCHVDRSGFEGPWTENPFTFDNSYFKDLINKPWNIDISGAGNTQFVHGETMMLPTDWDLIAVPETKIIVEQYANDETLFFNDFSIAWQRLIEGGYDNLYSVNLPKGKDDL